MKSISIIAKIAIIEATTTMKIVGFSLNIPSRFFNQVD
jgi:hypothetical protein